MNYFWTNTIWYLLLGLITIFELAFILIKTQRRQFVLAHYISLTGATLLYEAIIFIFLKAYFYYPHIIQNSYYDDGLAGNLFSQFSVASTAILIAVFDLNIYWIVALAGVYGLIEKLFIYLGIFTLYWYRTWMTFFSLILLFWFAKKIYSKSLKNMKPIMYYLWIFIGLCTLYQITINWAFMLTGLRDYSRTWLTDPINSRYLISLFIYSLLTPILMMIYFKKLKWAWIVLIILCFYGLNYIASEIHLFYFREGWFWFCSTITIIWIYGSIVFLDGLYKEKLL